MYFRGQRYSQEYVKEDAGWLGEIFGQKEHLPLPGGLELKSSKIWVSEELAAAMGEGGALSLTSGDDAMDEAILASRGPGDPAEDTADGQARLRQYQYMASLARHAISADSSNSASGSDDSSVGEGSGTAVAGSVLGRMLLQSGDGRRSDKMNHAKVWIEVEVLRGQKTAILYRIAEQNRQAERRFIATSDERYTFGLAAFDNQRGRRRQLLPHPLTTYTAVVGQSQYYYDVSQVEYGKNSWYYGSDGTWSVDIERECLIDVPTVERLA